MLKNIFVRFFVDKEDPFLFKLLGYYTKNPIYKRAFVHKSFNNNKHNEQLEFLGDAVLSFIIAETLLLKNPKKEEGFLSKKRAVIVSRKHLNLVGRKIIPKKKIKSNLETMPENVFGNTLEAVIGAIYIDKGIKTTKDFVVKNIYNSVFWPDLINKDFKSKLLRYTQRERIEMKYKTEKKAPSKFLVSVFLNGKKAGEAKANSKKEAEQAAAKKTLNSL